MENQSYIASPTDRIGTDLLEKAFRAWAAWGKFRSDRQRNKRYTFGRQWDDIISVDGRHIPEEQYIREQGNIPLKNNLIRRLVRNVLGVFRNSWTQPQCLARDEVEAPLADILNRLLECNSAVNQLEELYARSLEEFLISGFIAHRKWYGSRRGRTDCWTDCVQPDCFFLDSDLSDFRGWDATLVGELHDITITELITRFAGKNFTETELKRIYDIDNSCGPHSQFGMSREGSEPFFTPFHREKCRIIELWKLESNPEWICHDPVSAEMFRCSDREKTKLVDNINKQRESECSGQPPINARRTITEQWHYYYLTPAGHILDSGLSPYPDASHPYVFKAYPFIDGEIHSFVADVIDQQRYTNRLITLYDWIMRASAKGVLLFPEGALPEGADLRDVADQWSRFNGVITYKPKTGVSLPQQVSSNAANIGITELLDIQLKMFEDVSGVNGALQGKSQNSTISGTLYQQQTRNSLTSLNDLLKCYNSFILEATAKDAANIQRFYTAAHIEKIAGKNALALTTHHPGFGDMILDFKFK